MSPGIAGTSIRGMSRLAASRCWPLVCHRSLPHHPRSPLRGMDRKSISESKPGFNDFFCDEGQDFPGGMEIDGRNLNNQAVPALE